MPKRTSTKKFTACLDLYEMVGDPSKTPSPKEGESLLFTWGTKRLFVDLYLGVAAATTMLDVVKQAVLVFGAVQLKELDERISDGMDRRKKGGGASAKPVSDRRKEIDEAVAKIREDREEEVVVDALDAANEAAQS